MEKDRNKSNHKKIVDWVHNFSDDLYSWAFYKTNDRLAAEDLVQETFLAAYRSIDSFREESNPKTWVFKILNNKIIDYYRKSARYTFTSIDKFEREVINQTDGLFDKYNNWSPNGWEKKWENEPHLLDNPEFIKVMALCMDDLPVSWRTAVHWKYHQGKDAKEIYEALRITPSNYWQILHRAKLLLKKCIEKNWFRK